MYARSLIVVAHPGEETLGCARLLLREPQLCRILHVADGPVRDSRALRRAGAGMSPEALSALRSREVRLALGHFGLQPQQIASLGLAERDVLPNIELAMDAILSLIRAERPLELHTHPFEGGHPDADAVCFAVHKTLDILRREGEVCPQLFEFTSYHARDGLFRAAEFLSPYPSPQITLLSEAECGKKKEALRFIHSQYNLIARFSLCEERWRRAEAYDFGERPHQGPLYYEISRSGFTWEDFARFVNEIRDKQPDTPQSDKS